MKRNSSSWPQKDWILYYCLSEKTWSLVALKMLEAIAKETLNGQVLLITDNAQIKNVKWMNVNETWDFEVMLI